MRPTFRDPLLLGVLALVGAGLVGYSVRPSSHVASSAPQPVYQAPSSPPVAAPPAPAPAQFDPVVHVTRTGKRYHVAGCRALSRSDIPLRLSEALREGYTPCHICDPPTQ